MSARCENNQGDALSIIGAGLSGLLVAQKAALSSNVAITLYDDGGARPDHIWGYWDAGEAFLDAPRKLNRGSWTNWLIATPEGEAVLSGNKTRYQAVSSQNYETVLQETIAARVATSDRAFDEATDDTASHGIFDTAHYAAPATAMLQHFGGVEVTADRPCFDASTAVLMDFRVTQEHGIHFIYLLPFSETEALVESTMFSDTPRPAAWYREQINAYLAAFYAGVSFSHGAQENGVIPMAKLSYSGPGIGVGLAGGALRASSGYAFYQIHRQVARLRVADPQPPQPGNSRIESWMDGVFLRALTRYPTRAPQIFLAMARHLSGDEFARFMNGHAPIGLLLKVIFAVPKWPFIRSIL